MSEETIKPGLRYLEKTEINEELDNMFAISLIFFSEFDGKKCPTCGIKQGHPYKGWNKYYCFHTERKVNKKIKEKIKEKNIAQRIAFLTSCKDEKLNKNQGDENKSKEVKK